MASIIVSAIRVLAVFSAFSISGTAMASYVNADSVNCRASPDAKARVVAKLSRGQEVSVKARQGAWSRLASPSCWVSSRLLSEGYVAAPSRPSASSYDTFRESTVRSSRRQSSSNLYAFGSSTTKKSRKSAKRSKSSRSSGAYGSGGSCPCSGGSVCIGPRGGRYCITSGGNKRYGV